MGPRRAPKVSTPPRMCDVMVRLPLAGKVDSLNVSVSTGILLYEAVRQRA
jgi:tRNA G18 (ribose-2'-O)-methylase SpoU